LIAELRHRFADARCNIPRPAGATVMARGIAAGPRDAVAWLPMLLTGTLAGALLALDNALELDLTSLLYPVWQAGVAAGLATALRRTKPARESSLRAKRSNPEHGHRSSGLLRRVAPRNGEDCVTER
jgi:hypothetical protein